MLIQPKPSLLSALLFLAQYLLALLCIWSLRFDFLFSGIISMIVILHCIYVFNRTIFLKHAKSIISIHKIHHNDWKLHFLNGEEIQANLLITSVVTRYLLLLRFSNVNDSKQRYGVLLFSDSENRKTLQNLRATISMSL